MSVPQALREYLAAELWRGGLAENDKPGALDPAAAWKAAHADEDYQMAQWGLDDMALKRREGRFAEFMAAATVLKLVVS